MVCITGVSGSGKSTLINTVLYKHLYNHFNKDTRVSVNPKTKVKNIDDFKKVIQIDQNQLVEHHEVTLLLILEYLMILEHYLRHYLKVKHVDTK